MSSSYHHKDLYNALLKAGIAFLKQKGLHQLSLRKLASQVDVSHNAPYRHFTDKDELLSAIAEYGFNQLTRAMQKAMKPFESDAKQALRASGEAYIHFAIKNPELLELMFGGVIPSNKKSSSHRQAADQSFGVLMAAIEAGKAQKQFRDVATESLALTAWSSVHGLAILFNGGSLDGVGDKDAILAGVRDVLNHGIYR